MSATPQDVQAKIDAGLKNLDDAAANFLAAKTEAGLLLAPPQLAAAFAFTEG